MLELELCKVGSNLLHKRGPWIFRLFKLCQFSTCCIYAPLHPCLAALPGSLAWQPCPEALHGSLARQPCPVALPGSLALQPCPPGSLACKPCRKITSIITGLRPAVYFKLSRHPKGIPMDSPWFPHDFPMISSSQIIGGSIFGVHIQGFSVLLLFCNCNSPFFLPNSRPDPFFIVAFLTIIKQSYQT
jgi:hypothetical protein